MVELFRPIWEKQTFIGIADWKNPNLNLFRCSVESRNHNIQYKSTSIDSLDVITGWHNMNAPEIILNPSQLWTRSALPDQQSNQMTDQLGISRRGNSTWTMARSVGDKVIWRGTHVFKFNLKLRPVIVNLSTVSFLGYTENSLDCGRSNEIIDCRHGLSVCNMGLIQIQTLMLIF